MRERAGLEAPAETQNPSTALGAFRHKNSLGMTGWGGATMGDGMEVEQDCVCFPQASAAFC